MSRKQLVEMLVESAAADTTDRRVVLYQAAAQLEADGIEIEQLRKQVKRLTPQVNRKGVRVVRPGVARLVQDRRQLQRRLRRCRKGESR